MCLLRHVNYTTWKMPTGVYKEKAMAKNGKEKDADDLFEKQCLYTAREKEIDISQRTNQRMLNLLTMI